MDRLSYDFNRGYTQAIQDMAEEFASVQSDLMVHHKKLNYKMAAQLCKLFLEHRENFRERRSGFIRWNTKREELEFYEPNGK